MMFVGLADLDRHLWLREAVSSRENRVIFTRKKEFKSAKSAELPKLLQRLELRCRTYKKWAGGLSGRGSAVRCRGLMTTTVIYIENKV